MTLPEKNSRAAAENVLSTDRFNVMQAELAARSRQLSAVAELGQAAMSQVDAALLIGQACGLVVDVLGVDFCRMLEHLPEGGTLVCRAFVGRGRNEENAGVDDEALHALAADAPVVFHDLARETRFSGEPSLRRLGVTSGASVTLTGCATSFGVLGAYSVAPREFREYEVEFLQCIANVLATAIESRRMHEALVVSRAKAELADSQRQEPSAEKPLACDAIIVAVDADGTIARVNSRAAVALRCPESDAVGRPLAMLPAAEPWKTMKQLAAVVGDTEMTTAATAEEGGRSWEMAASALPMREDGGGRVVIVAHDLTTRAKREEVRYQADLVDATGSLVGGLAHRAWEPVRTLVDLLGRDVTEVALTADSLRKGRSAVFTLHSLLRDLEEFATPFALERVPASPREPLEEAIASVASAAQQRQIAIVRDYASSAEILLNHARLSTLFRDMLLTFLNRVATGRPVEVSLGETIARGRSLVSISVASAERVLRDDELALFDRIVPDPSRDCGIRFAVDRRIVDEHGGSIMARNDQRGSIVEVNFPLYRFTRPGVE